MSINKNYAVFGLGKYGKAVALELVNNGADVVAVDCDESVVESLIYDLPLCKCADVTDPLVIEQLGIENFDTVIIAMSEQLEASVMATMLCKEHGAGQVIVKCSDEMHKRVLEKCGADLVVQPEIESGQRLAKSIISAGFVDIADLSDEIAIVEFCVKKEWENKTLSQLDLRNKYSINVIAINENGNTGIDFTSSFELKKGMKLICTLNKKDIARIK